MHNCKLTLVLALGLALTIGGLTGCASKKKAPAQPVQETKAPEQKAAPAPVVKEAPKQIEEDLTPPSDLQLQTVYFDYDKSDIRDDQRGSLTQNAEILAKYKTLTVLIEGHCDERGTDEYNMALGERRADAVKRFLTDYGIDSSRISIVSYGEKKPAVQGNNEAAWSKNRRGEFVIK